MSLNKVRQQEKKTRDIICKALKDLDGENITIPAFRSNNLRDDEFKEKLSRPEIDAGIRAFTLIANIYGSDGDIDLYSLLHHYLHDKDIRKQIIDIVRTKYK